MKEITENQKEELIKKAMEARTFSYSPYSHFQVGAALLTEDGQVFSGCNIENAAYGPTNCAERTAIFKAVSEGAVGAQAKICAIAIVGGSQKEGIKEYTYPCGVCRQVLTEFGDAHRTQVIIAKSVTDYKIYRLEELLPFGFGSKDLP